MFGAGARNYFVTQICSKHVLGQNRSLEQGPDKYFATDFCKTCSWTKPLLGSWARKRFCDTEMFKSCPWAKIAPWCRGQKRGFAPNIVHCYCSQPNRAPVLLPIAIRYAWPTGMDERCGFASAPHGANDVLCIAFCKF